MLGSQQSKWNGRNFGRVGASHDVWATASWRRRAPMGARLHLSKCYPEATDRERWPGLDFSMKMRAGKRAEWLIS